MNFLSSLFSLPSLPALPTSYLPSLPSLPQNLQRRFLSFVLKRSLGHLVKAGALDPDRLEAQVVTGHVEVKGVELDEDAINSLIPATVPVRLESGSLGTLTVDLGSAGQPGSLAGHHAASSAPAGSGSAGGGSSSSAYSLNLSLSHLHLSLVLDASRSMQASDLSDGGPAMADLASSVLSVADEFVHGELDAREEHDLLASVRTLRRDQDTDPFLGPDSADGRAYGGTGEVIDDEDDDLWLPPGSMQPFVDKPRATGEDRGTDAEGAKTLVMGLVEGMLARLKVHVRDVRVRLRFPAGLDEVEGDCGDDGSGGAVELELLMSAVSYHDDYTASAPVGRSGPGKALRFASLTVALLQRPASASSAPTPTRRSSASTLDQTGPVRPSATSRSSSSSSSDGDPHSTLMMSQAIADLRDSRLTESTQSLYESATEGGASFLAPNPADTDLNPWGSSVEQPPTPEAAQEAQFWQTLLSLGDEDVILRFGSAALSTTRTSPLRPQAPSLQRSASSSSGDAGSRPASRISLAALHGPSISLQVPAVTALILPEQTEALSSIIGQMLASRPVPSEHPSTAAGDASRAPAPATHLFLNMRSVMVIAVYTDHVLPPAAIDAFWSKPRGGVLPAGHLVCTLGRIEALSSPSAPVVQPKGASLQRAADLVLYVEDLSVFEHLAPAVVASSAGSTDPAPAVAPILIVDPDLPKQYEGSFPAFDSHDWRSGDRARKAGAVEKAWRVRSDRAKFASSAKESSPADLGPALRATQSVTSSEVHVLPLHFFIDLALIDRLLPWLRSIPPVLASTKTRAARGRPEHPAASVLDSLDAEYPAGGPGRELADAPLSPSNLHVPFLRLEIRCPAPASSLGIGDGSYLRSGILTLDLRNAVARLKPAAARLQARSASESTAATEVEWQQLEVFFLRVGETRALSFVSVGLGSAVDSHDSAADGPALLPQIQVFPALVAPIRPGPRGQQSAGAQHLVCRLPSIQIDAHKATAEGLQYFVDDITQWLNGAFGDGSRPCPKEDIRLIGSRFFGARQSSFSSSSSDDGRSSVGGRLPPGESSESLITVEIADIDVTLRAPRVSSPADPVRVVQLWAAETFITFDTSIDLKKESTLRVAVGDLRFQDISHLEAPLRICERTSHRSLDSRPRPIISAQLVSSAELDLSRRDTDLEVSVFNCTVFASADLSWISDLALFAKPPAGAFEDVEPSEVTRVSLLLDETSFHILAPTLAGAIVVGCQDLLVSTELVHDAPSKTVGVSATAIHLLLIDDVKAPAADVKLKPGPPSSLGHWKSLGYAHVSHVQTLETLIDLRDFDPRLKVDVARFRVKAQFCPDSLATLAAVLGDLSKVVAKSSSAPSATVVEAETGPPPSVQGMTGSIEEQAFKHRPILITDADLVEDDVPRNFDYLDEHQGPRLPQLSEPLSAFETISLEPTTQAAAAVLSETDGETVKLLDPLGIAPVEDYPATLAQQPATPSSDTPSTKLRVRDCNASLELHDGFDWSSTQKAIELEVKSVRRRLEKIRQLLASGQMPDESIEQTGTMMFNSVYVGLPQYAADADADAYLAALGDDDLLNLDFADDTSQGSSFQSVKGRPSGGSPQLSAKGRAKRRRLTRSKHARIVISLTQVRVAIEAFGPTSASASSVRLTVDELEILDQIKTSTWKKFLTELRVDGRGNTREADSHMVTLELLSVRPADDVSREEYRLRAKILPLRLHVDQDALDFLKRFFAFRDTKGATAPAAGDAGAGSSKEVYLQHVEIFPIQLKLDYKPKRVDYRGLRDGRTIELMNFFHFDGAEMTLRRITLSGVSGWPRLFDMLNVLWTPDVKANQLADIITSIAPIRSLVNVGSGFADLVLLPLEQYSKDGRLIRGVQRGATSFVKSTAIEALKLGAGLATGTQVVLERAEHVLGGGRTDRFGSPVLGEAVAGGSGAPDELHSSSDDEGGPAKAHSRYAQQPADVKEGVSTAYRSLSRNLNSAAETILAVPMEVYEKAGTDGPVRAVVRAIPIAVLKPMIGASEAVSKTLFGLRNTIDPGARLAQEDKYGSR